MALKENQDDRQASNVHSPDTSCCTCTCEYQHHCDPLDTMTTAHIHADLIYHRCQCDTRIHHGWPETAHMPIRLLTQCTLLPHAPLCHLQSQKDRNNYKEARINGCTGHTTADSNWCHGCSDFAQPCNNCTVIKHLINDQWLQPDPTNIQTTQLFAIFYKTIQVSTLMKSRKRSCRDRQSIFVQSAP